MKLYLNGKTIYKKENGIIFEHNNIGWWIYTNDNQKIELNKFMRIYIYEYESSNLKTLYGFIDQTNRFYFLELLKVSKIGPKTALKIMKTISKEELISLAKTKNITKIQNLGLSERVATQLGFEFSLTKSKQEKVLNQSKIKSELKSSLKNIGFKPKTINNVVNEMKVFDIPFQDLLKQAIKISHTIDASNKK